jgi:hypothetical protein
MALPNLEVLVFKSGFRCIHTSFGQHPRSLFNAFPEKLQTLIWFCNEWLPPAYNPLIKHHPNLVRLALPVSCSPYSIDHHPSPTPKLEHYHISNNNVRYGDWCPMPVCDLKILSMNADWVDFSTTYIYKTMLQYSATLTTIQLVDHTITGVFGHDPGLSCDSSPIAHTCIALILSYKDGRCQCRNYDGSYR